MTPHSEHGLGQHLSYRIARDGTLHHLADPLISGGKGASAVDARLSTDGQTLYVNETKFGQIGEFAVDGGTLTEIGRSPSPLGAGAAGVAVNQTPKCVSAGREPGATRSRLTGLLGPDPVNIPRHVCP